MRCCLKRYITTLLLSFFILALLKEADAVTLQTISAPSLGLMSRIISIATHESETQTIINVLGNGQIDEYMTQTFDFPARIVVDIFCRGQSPETIMIPIMNPYLKAMRIGYHADKIRLVLDIKGDDIPNYKTEAVNNELMICLTPKNIKKKQTGKSNIASNRGDPEKTGVVKKPDNWKPENRRGDTVFSVQKHPTTVRVAPVDTKGHGGEVKKSRLESKMHNKNRKFPQTNDQLKIFPEMKLKRMVINDSRPDTLLFIKGLEAYNVQNWAIAIERFTHLIEAYPACRYVEKSYFLIAKAYAQSHSQSITTHFNEIINHYEKAINRFPKSEYIPDALFSIGNLYLNKKNYHEALGYYNLILKKDSNSILAARASIQKIRILLLKKKKEIAFSMLPDLERIIQKGPQIPEITEVQIEAAKIFYEVNNYHKSLDMLTELVTTDPQNVNQYPEISLYLGFNYYQLGESVNARKHLFRYYNSCPDKEMNHLLLSQIGDTYRDDGLNKDAAKLYELVVNRYPNTEGAFISMIRLAEQQEEGLLKIKRGNQSQSKKVDKEIGLPEEIYQEIINKLSHKDSKNSLVQLALLKLAVLHQKEKDCIKSIWALKELLKNYPWNSLGSEVKNALLNLVDSILKEAMKQGRFKNIIDIYQSEKELFLMMDDPEAILIVARAYLKLGLEDMAVSTFCKADHLYLDKEKPPDLLFYLGRDLYEKEKIDKALSKFKLLIENHPSDQHTWSAYQLMGGVFMKQKRYLEASGMFSAALRYPMSGCDKVKVLIDKAKALAKTNFNEKAFKTIQDADSRKGACNPTHHYILEDIGNLYFHLGYPQKALTVFNQALKIADTEAAKLPLQLKVARCYGLLDKTEDSLVIYDQVASIKDPFWSNIAKERIEEITFNQEIKKLN
jgi:tetratricopeptide (TPR) repeat protein